MNTISYIKDNGLDKLVEEFKLDICRHNDGRIILNYSQINSPRKHPIVDECRGLVLDSKFNLIARSFKRFYNLGEYPELEKDFIWEDSIHTHKLDGSLILYYFSHGSWNINTRRSFGEGEINGKTWHQLFNMARQNIKHEFDRRYTYVFELCSPYNMVVTQHQNTSLHLLSVFDGEYELPFSEIENLHFTVDRYNFSGTADILSYLDNQPGDFEGFVLRDCHNHRIKVKNSKYVALHHLNGNGNIALPKYFIPFLLKGEKHEILSYFPWLEKDIAPVEEQIEKWKVELDKLWEECYNLPQKEFALKVKEHPLSGILFTSFHRKIDWRKVFVDSTDLITKNIKVNNGTKS